MKKFLSIFLAVAFVFSAMCMSILAADETTTSTKEAHPENGVVVKDKQYWVVGKQDPTSDNLGNGVTDFDENTSVKSDVKINFNTSANSTGTGTTDTGNAIEERYAIDIVYSELIIDLTDIDTDTNNDENPDYKYVWDVNKHEYVMVETTNNTVVSVADTNITPIEIQAFQVINHSSLPITYSATLTIDTNVTDVMSTLFEFTNGNAATVTATVERTLANANTAASGEYHTIVATPKTSWLNTINTLAGIDKYAAGTGVIGSITVTFNKVATAPTP